MALSPVSFSVSGLPPALKEDVLRAGDSLGLQFGPNLVSNSTHLIADTVLSDKYRCAVDNQLPVVSADWLLHSAERGQLAPEVPYLLPPLHGLRIVVSGAGFDEEVRYRMEQLVQQLSEQLTEWQMEQPV